MTDLARQPLLTPFRMGDLLLPNRIVMAPLTRQRQFGAHSDKIDRERGNQLISEDLADLIAFSRPYIANPDLVERFATNAPLNNDIKSETIYVSGPEGYVDYPGMKQVAESAAA